MTESDAKVLSGQYHLKTVIDLRTTIEREEMPDLYRRIVTDEFSTARIKEVKQPKKERNIIMA